MMISNLNNKYIYCGRGKGYELQAGNTRYRGIVKEHAIFYAKAPGRKNKAIFVHKILRRLQEEDLMFVKLEGHLNLTDWTPVGPTDARHKVAHSLRDAVAMIHKTERRRQRATELSSAEVTADKNDRSSDSFTTDEFQAMMKDDLEVQPMHEDDGFETFLSSLVAREAENIDFEHTTESIGTQSNKKVVSIGPKPAKFIPSEASECFKFLGSGKTDSYLRCLTVGCSGTDSTF